MLGDGDLGMSERARQLQELDSGEVDAVEELVGELEQPDTEGDDLEFAADIKRRMPTADELAFKSQLRDAKWDQLNEQAPFARINPPSILKGTLGGQQRVCIGGPLIVDATGIVVPARTQVALWGGEDAETMPITVTFAPVQVLNNVVGKVIPPPPFRTYGIVKFGTRGFLVMAEVDIGSGCQFTVSGSQISLEVAVEDTSALSALPLPPLGPVDDFVIQLAGMLSFRPVVKTAPVTRTLFIDGLGAGLTSGVLNIPPFAKRLWLVCAAPAVASTITILDSVGNIIEVVPVAAGVVPEPITLPNDAAAVTVTNNDLAIPATFRLVFGLEF
jgi:hypothetical protein